MSRIRFARRALQDLWDYDRWRGHPNQGWDPVAIALRRTISVYLERFPTYDDLPFRALTIMGRTEAGRSLFVVYVVSGGRYRVITARELTPGEKHIFRKRRHER